MTKTSREFQVFIKPAGPSCNLRCRYCYYLAKKNLYPETKVIRMSDELLEKYIIQHIDASTENEIGFSWHGGEPLLAGIEFFRKVTELQQKHKPYGRRIINGVQTNGTLLNEEWCSFFSDEGFIAGISIDGPGELHNIYRLTKEQSPSLKHVLHGFELLQKHGVTTEILCVLSSANVDFPLVVYDFFKQLGAKFMTFLPLVIQESGSGTGVSPESVAPERFGIFLKEVFEEWVEKDIGKIKIQIFEEVLRTAFSQEHTLCIFKANCGGVPVVEHNGDFYSCDHYVDKKHLIGNINNTSLSELLDSPEQEVFGRAKSGTLPRYCLECPVISMCNGECPKNRFIKTPDGEPGLNYLCRGYKLFFTHCQPFVKTLRTVWLNQQQD